MRGKTQRTRLLAALILNVILMTAADAKPLRINETELEPADFSVLDRWAVDDHAASFATFRKSCSPIL